MDERGLRDWSLNGTSTANTLVTITKAAETGKRHIITSYVAALRNAAGEAVITIRRGSTVIWTDTVRQGSRAAHVFSSALIGGVGELVSLEASAGGAGAVVEVNMEGASTG